MYVDIVISNVFNLKKLLLFIFSFFLLAWGRSGRTNAAKIECAHRRARKLLTDYNHRILTFHSIYDYILY